MAQIIKHRRGSISDVKTTTTRNGEILVASGSISDLSGPFVFIGSPVSSDEGVAGAFKPTSKVYTGTNAPTIAAGTYGSILDGTPFYASSNQSLYILNNDGVGNSRIDLTGNIEGNSISNVTITSVTGSNANITNINSTNITGGTVTITGNETIGGTLGVTGGTQLGGVLNVTGNSDLGGTLTVAGDTNLDSDLLVRGNITGSNLQLLGDANIIGNITLGGNISVGDSTTDFVTFGADISSSIVPDVNDAFDLGTVTKSWRNLYVSGTAIIDDLVATNINLDSITVVNNLTVEGSVNIGDDATDTLQVISGDIEFANIPNGNTTTFVGLDDNNKLVKDSLDTRTLGDTLLDNNGTPLTANRVPFAADGDSLTDDGDFTFDGVTNILSVAGTRVGNDVVVASGLTVNSTSQLKGAVGMNSTLNVTGSAQFKSTLGVDGQATLASVNVRDLTTESVVFVGVDGELVDSNKFTFDGNRLNLTADLSVVGNGSIDGSLTVTTDVTVDNDAIVKGNLNVSGTTNLDGNLYISGNLEVLGNATQVILQSQTLEIDDNIIRLNAYSPFERYAGFEVIDSGSSGVSASLVWDSQNDYWMFVSSSGDSSKLIGTTPSTYGSESSLTNNVIPKGTGGSSIGDSLLSDNGTSLKYNTNKFTVASADGATLIAGNVTLSSEGGIDDGSKTSRIMFRNGANVVGYVPREERSEVMDGILGYKHSDGSLIFSTVIDGGTY